MLYKAKPLSRKAISNYARKIRKFCNAENTDYFDIMAFLEKILPKYMSDFSLEVVKKEDLPNDFGKTITSEHRMIIREDIYYDATKGDWFSRFTLGHETFHLLKHTEQSLVLCRAAIKPKPYEDSEWQANAFSGELFAPNYLIEGKSISRI